MQPILIVLENFFSHKFSEIDFRQFQSALLVGSTDGDYSRSNGSGKSSILEGILWALFNKTRAKMMDDIILFGENSCSVEFQFSVAAEQYKIKRTRGRANSSSVDFFQFKNNQWKSLSGSTSTETNDKILSVIKTTFQSFINSIYFRQGDISEFATAEAGRRKEILKSIIDLSKWDDYEKKSKAKLKSTRQEIAVIQSKVDELSVEIENLSFAEKKLETTKEELKSLTTTKAAVEESYKALYLSWETKKNNNDEQRIQTLNLRAKELEGTIKRESLSLDKYKNMLSEKAEKSKDLNNKIELCKNYILITTFDSDAESKLEKSTEELIERKTSLRVSNEKLKELSQIKIEDGVCSSCGQDISSDISDQKKAKHKHNVSFFETKKDNCESRIKYLNSYISELTEEKRKKESVESSKIKLESYINSLSTLTSEVNQLSEKISDLSESIINFKGELSSIKDSLSVIGSEDLRQIKNNLDTKLLELKSLEKSIFDKGVEIGVLNEKLFSFEQKKLLLDQVKEKNKSLQSLLAAQEILVKMFSKTGIQTVLLESIIQELEKKSNDILSNITIDQISISLDTQREGATGDIVETLDLNVKKDGEKYNFSSLSGGEQFRVALALRIGLSELAQAYSGGTAMEFLLLDEISSPLDRSGVETLFLNIIKALEQRYKIIVITHDESLKEKFDYVIEVQKISGESSCIHYSK